MNTKIITLYIAVVLLLVPAVSSSMEEKVLNDCKEEQKVKPWGLCDHDADWSFDVSENICCKMFFVLECALLPVTWPIFWYLNKQEHQKSQ